MRSAKILLAVACFIAGSAASAADAPPAGTASIVAGTVSAVTANGVSRRLQKDYAVYSGDRILTGAASYVRLGFLDGSSMVLRPNTEFAIESFRYQPGVVESVTAAPPAAVSANTPALQVANQGVASTGNQSFYRLVRGGFRAISGLVGKVRREEYAVRTPVATIGIRGTIFWSVYCDALCVADSTVQGSLPAGETALGGTISAVDQGSIALTSDAGQVATVESSQFMLTTASGSHVLLPGLPGFLAAEDWLKAAQAAAAKPAPPPESAALSSAALSTVPTAATLATAVLFGAVVLTTNDDDGAGPPTTNSTSSTRAR